jgi:hypothetical protein
MLQPFFLVTKATADLPTTTSSKDALKKIVSFASMIFLVKKRMYTVAGPPNTLQ